jgi:methyltransferase (TIGR00027 family)
LKEVVVSVRPAATRALPPNPNLEQQRKRARALLKAARAHDAAALRRLAIVHPSLARRSRGATAASVSLHDAQLVIAREYGFTSWAKMKAHIDTHAAMTPVGTTALVMAANRALESELEHPLYRDRFARQLAGPAGSATLLSMRRMIWPGFSTGPDPYLSIRTRYFDDALRRVARDASLTQIVLLASGMDARAFRLAWPSGLTLFELDRDELFDRKEAVLRSMRARAACRRRIVRTDLSGSWTAALLKAGFDPSRKSMFLLEGVLSFLDSAVVAHVFQGLRSIASPGSWIGLDVPSAETLASPFMRPWRLKQEELGRPPAKFGLDDPEAFLAAHGWQGTSVVAGAPEANFGRWPYAYLPRTAPGIPRIFLTEGWMTEPRQRSV